MTQPFLDVALREGALRKMSALGPLAEPLPQPRRQPQGVVISHSINGTTVWHNVTQGRPADPDHARPATRARPHHASGPPPNLRRRRAIDEPARLFRRRLMRLRPPLSGCSPSLQDRSRIALLIMTSCP